MDDQPITELEILQSAANAGQWGFSFDMRNVGASPTGLQATNSLLTVDTPEFFARTWTLNLLAPRYQGGTVTSTNGEPPENAVSLPGMFCRLDYGVGAAMEQVEFDYNARGCTVQFHASIIRVYLNLPTTFGASAPLLGGFLAPAPRGNVAADMLPACTWTTGAFTFNGPAAPSQFAWAPRRARGYRMVPASAGTIGTSISTFQLRHDQVVLAQDYASIDFDGSIGTIIQDRVAYAPLIQGAVGIQMTSGVGAAQANWRVQWLLDIG